MATGPALPTTQSSDELAVWFRARIAAGAWRPGERLPTIRAVAEETGASRSAVQQAYRQLADAGLVTATVGRGTTVAGPAAERGRFSASATAALAALRDMPEPPVSDVPVVADFAGLRPDPARFPVGDFRASIDRVLGQGGMPLGYGEGGGDALPALLARRHGADPAGVLITSGAQQGIELAIRTLLSPGDAVAVAVPTYPQLFGVLAAHGIELVPIDAPDGIAEPRAVAAALARPQVRLLYVMPSFHNPTAATLDVDQRRALMDVVTATDAFVIEDEFESELRFAGDEPPSLASQDPRGRTVTVRSFSKALFPGVRLGWLETEPALLGPMRALKRFSDLESSRFLQEVLVDFVQRGAMDRYLTELRADLAARQRAAATAFAESLPAGSRWATPEGGLATWVTLPPGIDADRVAERAAREGVLVMPGRMFDPLRRPSRGLRLALSCVDADGIRRGVAILGRAAGREAPAGGRALHTPLIL